MAFACRPAVIVLDEPTTGLDVTHAGPRPRHRPRPVPHPRRGRPLRHPRPGRRRQPRRPGGGDVRRSGGRAGTDGAALRPAGAPLHPPPHRRRARHGRRAGDHRAARPGPLAWAPAARVHVRAALRGSPPRSARRASRRSPSSTGPPTSCAATTRCRRSPSTVAGASPVPTSAADAALTMRHVSASYAGVAGRARRRAARRPRRVPGPRRRVRLGQDDAVAVGRRPAPRVDRRDPDGRHAAGHAPPATVPWSSGCRSSTSSRTRTAR